jgi:predicted PurR-regulated permease PerM
MNVSPSGRRETAGWVLVGSALSALVAFVVVSFVGSIVVGLFLYYATRPANRWLDAHTGMRRTSAAVTRALVGVPILLVLGYAAYVGYQEFDQFLVATDLEALRDAVEPYLGDVSSLDRQSLIDLLRGNLSRVGTAVVTVAGWFLRLFIILTFAYYLLKDDDKIAGWFRESFEDNPAVVRFVENVDDELTTLYTGNLLVIGATAGIAVVVFVGLDGVAPAGSGFQYPVLLGLLIGVGTLIPAVGMKLIYVPYTAILVWRSQATATTPLWFPVAFFAATFVFVDLLPDTLVRSYVASGTLNMGLVMLSYVLGAAVFGWYGIFLAPLLLVAFVRFARDVFPQLV